MRAFAIETALLLALAFAIGLAIGLYLRARRAKATGAGAGAARLSQAPAAAPAPASAATPAAAPTEGDGQGAPSALPAAGQETPGATQGELLLGGTEPAPVAKDREKGSARTPAKAGMRGKAEADHPGRRPLALEAPEAGSDDLKLIKGIGPQNEARLNALGIHHLSQIAAWTEEEALWVGSYLAFPGRIEREGWIGQARALIAGTRPEDLRLPPRRPG